MTVALQQPCKDCAASASVTVILSFMSQIQTQALQLHALDLNALQPTLGLAGARAVSDILPRLRSLLALALDNNELGSAGVQVMPLFAAALGFNTVSPFPLPKLSAVAGCSCCITYRSQNTHALHCSLHLPSPLETRRIFRMCSRQCRPLA